MGSLFRFRVDIFFFEWSETMTLACAILFDKEVEPGLDSCLGLWDSRRGHLKSRACHLAWQKVTVVILPVLCLLRFMFSD